MPVGARDFPKISALFIVGRQSLLRKLAMVDLEQLKSLKALLDNGALQGHTRCTLTTPRVCTPYILTSVHCS